jgi:hypothetical protein
MQEAETFLRSNGSAVFEGDSLALLVSIYKNEELPLSIRHNAACAAIPFEHPRMSDARVLLLQAQAEKQQLIDDDARADELRKERENFEREIAQLRAEIVEDRDAQLQAWVSAGKLTTEMALEIRQLWAEPADAPARFHEHMLAMPDVAGECRPKPRALPPPREEPLPEPPRAPIRETPPPPAREISPPPEPFAGQLPPEPEGDDLMEIVIPTRGPGGSVRLVSKWVPRG